VLHVLVVIVVPLFTLAGFWQLHRLDERRTKNAQIRARESAPARSLDDVLSDGDASFRRIRVSGHYDTSTEVVLIGRPGDNGVDGSHVLTPFVIDEHDAVLVDRGWVPPGLERAPVRQARPPDGKVTITGILFPTEGREALSTGGTEGKLVDRIDVGRLAHGARHRFITTDLYVLLRSQSPRPEKLPELVHPAGLSEGPHLGYAVQWFLFIPTLLAVYTVLLRQQMKRPTP
jgi:surfeit locus 1 family protein